RRLWRGGPAPPRLAQPARHLRLREGDAQQRPDPLRDRRRAVHQPGDPAAHPVPDQQRAWVEAGAQPGRAPARAALLLLNTTPTTTRGRRAYTLRPPLHVAAAGPRDGARQGRPEAGGPSRDAVGKR